MRSDPCDDIVLYPVSDDDIFHWEGYVRGPPGKSMLRGKSFQRGSEREYGHEDVYACLGHCIILSTFCLPFLLVSLALREWICVMCLCLCLCACVRVLQESIAETPFENGYFKLDILVPRNYPLQPPRVRFVTKVFHPNIHFKVLAPVAGCRKRVCSPDLHTMQTRRRERSVWTYSSRTGPQSTHCRAFAALSWPSCPIRSQTLLSTVIVVRWSP